MKLTMRSSAGALSLALAMGLVATGCSLVNATKSEGQKAGDSNSTAKNPTQGAPNPTIGMSVYTPYSPYWPKDGAGLKQGFWVSSKISGTGYSMESKFAVVAAAGDIMKLELTDAGTPKGYIKAETVKSTGEVAWAGVGKKGDKPKNIDVKPTPAGAAPAAPTVTDEDVTVKAGTFKSKKSVSTMTVAGKDYTTTSWSGTDGDTKDVMLKMVSGTTTSELSEAPAMEDWTCSGKTYKVKHLKYSDGRETWTLADSWPFVGAVAKSVASGSTTEITGMGDDAKAELNWEGK